jgi:hypothetical protein
MQVRPVYKSLSVFALSRIKGSTQAEGVWEYGAEENIGVQEAHVT